MKLFNDQAAAAVASLDSADAAYCAKLEQRSPIWASAQRQPPAPCNRSSRPMPCPRLASGPALPSAFKGLFQKKTEVKPVASEAFEASLSEALA